jgi:hypothetical protein
MSTRLGIFWRSMRGRPSAMSSRDAARRWWCRSRPCRAERLGPHAAPSALTGTHRPLMTGSCGPSCGPAVDPLPRDAPATYGDLSRRPALRSSNGRRRCIVIRKLACALSNPYFSRSFRRNPTHSVALSCGPATMPARIRFPRDRHGAWRSLVAHLLWEQRVGGSNPSAPTIPKKGGTVGPVSYIIADTPDDGCGTEHGLAAIRSAL